MVLRHLNNSFCVYEGYHVTNGSLLIKKFDLQNHIISGRLNLKFTVLIYDDTVTITDGRFDLLYSH